MKVKFLQQGQKYKNDFCKEQRLLFKEIWEQHKDKQVYFITNKHNPCKKFRLRLEEKWTFLEELILRVKNKRILEVIWAIRHRINDLHEWKFAEESYGLRRFEPVSLEKVKTKHLKERGNSFSNMSKIRLTLKKEGTIDFRNAPAYQGKKRIWQEQRKQVSLIKNLEKREPVEEMEEIKKLKEEIKNLDKAYAKWELSKQFWHLKEEGKNWKEKQNWYDKFDFSNPNQWAEKEILKREEQIRELERKMLQKIKAT